MDLTLSVNLGMPLIQRSMYCWVVMNQLMEATADAWYRLEDLNPSVLCKQLEIDCEIIAKNLNVPSSEFSNPVPEDVNNSSANADLGRERANHDLAQASLLHAFRAQLKKVDVSVNRLNWEVHKSICTI